MTEINPISAPSPNFDERAYPVDMLVLHYTGMENGPSALDRMRDPDAKVSAHYMVEEDGQIFQLVSEDKRAWHAGVASWMGHDDLNSRSVGIEIVNGGHDFGLPPFPDAQIDAVIALSAAIVDRWAIPARRLVAHSDIAPSRKADPGEMFPWARLAEAGLGLWPERPDVGTLRGVGLGSEMKGEGVVRMQGGLTTIGYDLPITGVYDAATEVVVRAFQRRWRADAVTGQADLTTLIMIERVADLARRSGIG
ncbi:MAG: N-acetylmuramoyl-L-alanine amidase [Pseudomonadota bacterium]